MSAFFALLGIGSAIIASEINSYHNLDDLNKGDIVTMLCICDVSTFFLGKYFLIFNFIALSTVARYYLVLRWKKTKLILSDMDGLWNTGAWKMILFEIGISLIMPYPSLYGEMYIENANDFDIGKEFYSNDLLLALMMFCRIHYIVRALLHVTIYTDPRA